MLLRRYELSLYYTMHNIPTSRFAGPNEDQMYVTSAHSRASRDIVGDVTGEQKQKEFPDSGHLFVVDLAGKYKGGKWRHSFAG